MTDTTPFTVHPYAPPAQFSLRSHPPTTDSVSLAKPVPALAWQAPASPPPYVLPFQLRSVSPRNSVRIDTIVAPYRYQDANALQTVIMVSGQVRIGQSFFLQARWGFDDNRVANGTRNRSGVLNPSIGGGIAVPIGHLFRFAASTAINLPLATGGGDGSDEDALLLQRQGMLARSAMDNNAFVVNDLGFPTGLSFAFVHRGVTAQVDGTVIASGRVKGAGNVNDSARVNATSGLFLGYFLVPEISVGAELRYQYFLLPPAFVEQDPSARSNLTAGAGTRVDIELSGASRMRPGLCLSMGLAGYVEQQSYRMVQFDVPISF
jgi:hypothetical protein